MTTTKSKKHQVRHFGLIKNGQAIHCWKCLPCGIAGKWFRTEQAAKRTAAEHQNS